MRVPVFASRGDFDHHVGAVRQTAILSREAPHHWFLLLVEVENVVHEESTSLCSVMTQEPRGFYGRTCCGPPCLVYQGMYDEHELVLTEAQRDRVYPDMYYSSNNKFTLTKATDATCRVLEISSKMTPADYPEGCWINGSTLTHISIPYKNIFFFKTRPSYATDFYPKPSKVGWHVQSKEDGYYGTIVGQNEDDMSQSECWNVRVDCILRGSFIVSTEERVKKAVVQSYYAHIPTSSKQCWTPPEATWPSTPLFIRTYLDFKEVTCVPPSALYVPTLGEFQKAFLKVCNEHMPFVQEYVRGKIVRVGPIDEVQRPYSAWTWIHIVAASQRYHVRMQMHVANDMIDSCASSMPEVGDIVFADVSDGRGAAHFRDGRSRLPEAEVVLCRNMEPGFDEFCRFITNKGYNNSPKWPMGKSRLHDIMLYFWDPRSKENKAGIVFRQRFLKF